jgi:hypothetical protein
MLAPSCTLRAFVCSRQKNKVLINVSIVHLPKNQRQALVTGAVHRVSVYGRIEMKGSRATIKAEKVTPIETALVASER